MSLNEMRANEMMAHLLDSLAAGEDIGHYGRLVVAMVGRHFAEDDAELIDVLAQSPGFGAEEAAALVEQVNARGYNPPRRERILEWQQRQDFPICPNAEDPRAGNVYRDLTFPNDVYQDIEEFHEDIAEARAEDRVPSGGPARRP